MSTEYGMTIAYKTLNGTRGSSGHGDYSKYMPHGTRPGKWLPKVKPVLCESGYHGCRDLSEVLNHPGPELYEVEVRGACVEGDDKAAWEQMRLLRRIAEWNPTTRCLFTIDCARHVQDLWHPDDREMLTAALDIFTAEAEYGGEWQDAAEEAAWAAWDARDATMRTALDARDAAAWDVRAATVRTALAARDAVGRDARDAVARDAWDAWAARDARDAWAARDAWDAEKAWQVDTLTRYLAGEVGPFVEEEG